jgi:membrane protease YdiL (CAAX protease family)
MLDYFLQIDQRPGFSIVKLTVHYFVCYTLDKILFEYKTPQRELNLIKIYTRRFKISLVEETLFRLIPYILLKTICSHFYFNIIYTINGSIIFGLLHTSKNNSKLENFCFFTSSMLLGYNFVNIFKTDLLLKEKFIKCVLLHTYYNMLCDIIG